MQVDIVGKSKVKCAETTHVCLCLKTSVFVNKHKIGTNSVRVVIVVNSYWIIAKPWDFLSYLYDCFG
jgi:hypothetical protein